MAHRPATLIAISLCLLAASTQLITSVQCAAVDDLARFYVEPLLRSLQAFRGGLAGDEQEIHHRNSSFRRALLSTNPSESYCIWSGSTYSGSCALNSNFAASLNGTPTTESQKFLAQQAALDNVCGNYKTSSTCKADTTHTCSWNYATLRCTSDPGAFKTQWLEGRIYCAGSPIEAYFICGLIKDQAACTADSRCTWQSAAEVQSSVNSLIGLGGSLGAAASNAASDSASLTGGCAPKWAVDEAMLDKLTTELLAAANKVQYGGDPFGLLQVLVGTCSLPRLRELFNACAAATSRYSCEAIQGCAYASSACSMSDRFPYDILLDASDPWVQAINTAVKNCKSISSTYSCAVRFPNITVDTDKLSSYLQLQPDFQIYSSKSPPPPVRTPSLPNNSAIRGMPGTSLLVGLLVAIVSFRVLLL